MKILLNEQRFIQELASLKYVNSIHIRYLLGTARDNNYY